MQKCLWGAGALGTDSGGSPILLCLNSPGDLVSEGSDVPD